MRVCVCVFPVCCGEAGGEGGKGGGVGFPRFLGRGMIYGTEFYNGKPQRPSRCDALGKEEFIQESRAYCPAHPFMIVLVRYSSHVVFS